MIIISVIVPRTYEKSDITYILGSGKKYVNSSVAVRRRVQKIMNEALSLTVLEVEMWIDTKAAMLTGALRSSLKKFLNRSKPPPAAAHEIRPVRLVLGVGADIDYAKYVNRMPTGQVRHPRDPRAEGYYHDKMVTFGKERFRVNFQKAKNTYNS